MREGEKAGQEGERGKRGKRKGVERENKHASNMNGIEVIVITHFQQL